MCADSQRKLQHAQEGIKPFSPLLNMAALPASPESQTEPARFPVIPILNDATGRSPQIALLLLQPAKPTIAGCQPALDSCALEIVGVCAVRIGGHLQLISLQQQLESEFPDCFQHREPGSVRMTGYGHYETLVDERG